MSGMSRSVTIGERLRYVRTQHAMSQRELAHRVGIANSTISLIESNSTNPSLAALKRILDGIPVPMADFFAIEPKSQGAFFPSHEIPEFGKDKVLLKQIGTGKTGHGLQLFRERYEPGADTGRVMLSHEGERAGLVLSGCVEVTAGTERRILQVGDGFYLDSATPYRLRCVGSEPCEVVSASSSPSF
jgi:transcriptional regulator with XRE-family HTH domain